MKCVFLFFLSLLFSFSFAQNIDLKSKKIIDKSIEKMGGYENWDQIKYLEWEQSGKKIYWNKHNNHVRVENKNNNTTTLLNTKDLYKSKAYKGQKIITDSLLSSEQIKRDLRHWKMSIYKLAMPWKLEDPGVYVKYIKKGKTETNTTANILEITFDNNNSKYWAYITTKQNLLEQCDYFNNKKKSIKKFSLYWNNYQKLQNVLLSFNSKTKKGPKNLKVQQDYKPNFFTEY